MQDTKFLFNLLGDLTSAADQFAILQVVCMFNILTCLAKVFKYFDAQARHWSWCLGVGLLVLVLVSWSIGLGLLVSPPPRCARRLASP